MPNSSDRPRPILDAVKDVAGWRGMVGGLLAALVPFGIISVDQAAATEQLAGGVSEAVLIVAPLVGGLITLATAVLTAFGILKRAEPQTTPVSDPRDDRGARLVPAPVERA